MNPRPARPYRGPARRRPVAAVGLGVAAVASGIVALTATGSDVIGPATQGVTGSAVGAPAARDDPAPAPPRPGHPAARHAALPAAAPLPRSAPVQLRIPSIDVAARMVDLGLTDTGALEVPRGPVPVGWYVGAPTPGSIGPAVLAGHVSWNGTPAVFERLAELRAGDRVSVLRADGRIADFRVTRTAEYPQDRFPTDLVYGDLDHAGLRLITCSGLDAQTRVFERNVVVYARLTGVRRGPRTR